MLTAGVNPTKTSVTSLGGISMTLIPVSLPKQSFVFMILLQQSYASLQVSTEVSCSSDGLLLRALGGK